MKAEDCPVRPADARVLLNVNGLISCRGSSRMHLHTKRRWELISLWSLARRSYLLTTSRRSAGHRPSTDLRKRLARNRLAGSTTLSIPLKPEDGVNHEASQTFMMGAPVRCQYSLWLIQSFGRPGSGCILVAECSRPAAAHVSGSADRQKSTCA
jgi:hypothetical protein